ncbi:hypothetical protein C0J45_11346 [Silurus meridionalis]|nr:hypothetical protein C0J45_11346 [Silurus meridionalis]
MVVHEEPGMMPRPGVDYSILSTVASSSVSDHKKIKTHPAMKELNKEKRKKHKHPKPSQGYREENGKSKTTPRAHEGGESMLEWPSSSSFSSRISTKTQVEAEVDFKEHKIYTRESRGGDGNKGGMQVELQAVNKRPSSSTDSFLRTKNLKSLFLDSDSYDIEDPHHHKQEQLPPIPKLNTNNLKILHKKNPDFSQRENVLQENKAYTEELVDLHRRLMALREKNTLQEIVNLIEKTGLFNITKTTFDFDLFSLDVPTVRKLQSYLRAKRS